MDGGVIIINKLLCKIFSSSQWFNHGSDKTQKWQLFCNSETVERIIEYQLSITTDTPLGGGTDSNDFVVVWKMNPQSQNWIKWVWLGVDFNQLIQSSLWVSVLQCEWLCWLMREREREGGGDASLDKREGFSYPFSLYLSLGKGMTRENTAQSCIPVVIVAIRQMVSLLWWLVKIYLFWFETLALEATTKAKLRWMLV